MRLIAILCILSFAGCLDAPTEPVLQEFVRYEGVVDDGYQPFNFAIDFTPMGIQRIVGPDGDVVDAIAMHIAWHYPEASVASMAYYDGDGRMLRTDQLCASDPCGRLQISWQEAGLLDGQGLFWARHLANDSVTLDRHGMITWQGTREGDVLTFLPTNDFGQLPPGWRGQSIQLELDESDFPRNVYVVSGHVRIQLQRVTQSVSLPSFDPLSLASPPDLHPLLIPADWEHEFSELPIRLSRLAAYANETARSMTGQQNCLGNIEFDLVVKNATHLTLFNEVSVGARFGYTNEDASGTFLHVEYAENPLGEELRTVYSSDTARPCPQGPGTGVSMFDILIPMVERLHPRDKDSVSVGVLAMQENQSIWRGTGTTTEFRLTTMTNCAACSYGGFNNWRVDAATGGPLHFWLYPDSMALWHDWEADIIAGTSQWPQSFP